MRAVVSLIVSETLRAIDMTEDAAAYLVGFDVADAIVERAISAYGGVMPTSALDVADFKRWIVAETLRYVEMHDHMQTVYSAVYASERRAQLAH